jgi:hypothetical protein
MFPSAAIYANGYEPIDYKAFSDLFGQNAAVVEKTIANCRESAQAPPMSRNPECVVRGSVGLSI